MDDVKKILRWIGVLPGAVFGLVASYAVFKLFSMASNWFIGLNPDSPSAKFFELLISGASGYFFVYIGSKIAPANKKIVAYVLAGIIIMLSGVLLLFNLQQGEYYSAVAAAATAIGGMVFLYSVNSGEVDLDEPIF